MAAANALNPYAVRTCFVLSSEMNKRAATVDPLLNSISLFGGWSRSVRHLYGIYCRSEAGTELVGSKGLRRLLNPVIFEGPDDCVPGMCPIVQLILCLLSYGRRQPADKSRDTADQSPPTCFALLTRGCLMWYVCRSKAIHTGINESFMEFKF